jgi:hypothetical protein
MADSASRNPAPGYDPEPNVATPEEIRRAEELRHRLEQRYFGNEGGAGVSPLVPRRGT